MAGQAGRTPQTRPRHYNVATTPYHRPGMATQTKTPNTPGQAGFLSPQRHVNRAGATIFFSHKIPQKGIDQEVCHSRDSFCCVCVCVCVCFVFVFSCKSESTTLSLRHFRERKQWSPKDKNNPLAGRAGSRIWKTNLHQ